MRPSFRFLVIVAWVAAAIFGVRRAAGDEPLAPGSHRIPASEYIRYMPLTYGRAVRQTEQSEAVHLFGDRASPSYIDTVPADGIDDTRGRLLLAVGARFSPIMVRNTTAVPMDWTAFVTRKRSFPLHVDRWDLSTSPPQLVRREEVDFASLATRPCPGSDPDAAPLVDDCALLRLLRDFDVDHPSEPRARTLADPASAAPFTVMYFDFPGDDPESWNAEYRAHFSKELPRAYQGDAKIYVHPFVTAGRGNAPGLELVLQYWFFYPWNDGANKHVGDWEHVNVVVSPRSRVATPLSESDINAMLARDPGDLDGADPLVIRRIDYYLHSKVFIADFATPNVYLPRAAWRDQVEALPKERRGEKGILEHIRARAYADREERKVNTHPVVFIGGESKGLELLLSPPGPRSEDSHASFPFRGTYKDVGPAAATEEITSTFDLHDYAGKSPSSWPANVERFDDPKRLELLPDWERVHDLVLSNADVRRRWSWLLLPLRWGYPAVPSPIAGIVSHAPTGNLSPLGPIYNEGNWNRSGEGGSFTRYEPHSFSGIVPLSPLDVFQNDFGFLNAPFLVVVTLPPFDLVYRLLWRPLRAVIPPGIPSVYVHSAPSQRRAIGIALGMYVSSIPDSFGAIFLNSAQLPQITQRLAAAGIPPDAPLTVTSVNPVYPSLQVQFYHLPWLVSQNTFRYSRSDLTAEVRSAAAASDINGSLEMFEWAGSLRFNLLTGRIQPFLKAGFGYSWYRVLGVTVGDADISPSDSPFLNAPSFDSVGDVLPNTLHYGLGLEAQLFEPVAPLTGFGFALKAELNNFHHSLGFKVDDSSALGLKVDTFITRPNADLAAVVTF